MTSTFSWDQFQPLQAPAQMQKEQPKDMTGEFNWDSFESLPQYDAQKENEEPEGQVSGFFRNLFQVPKGLANLHPAGIVTNLLSALGTGEALSALDEDFSPERIADLKQKFPMLDWQEFDRKYPTHEDFRKSYLEGVQGASEAFPTVENISRGIENLTGLPLASKTIGHEVIQLLTGGFGPAFTAKLSAQPSKFTGSLNKIKSFGVKDKSVGSLVQKQLAKDMTQAEIIAEGRRLNFTDAEIAPLLNSETKTKFLSKVANKGGRSEKILGATRDKLSNSYEVLKGSEAAAQPFSKALQSETLTKLKDTLSDLPDVIRQGILTDTHDLLKNPHLNGKNLIAYRQKVQKVISSDPEKYKALSPIKKVLDDAIAKSNPQLAKEYNTLNNLYSKYASISKALKPGIVDKFVSKGEALAAMYGILTFNLPLIGKVAGEAGARRIATEFLVNPKFQQLSSKLVNALNQNKLGVAAKIAEEMSKDIRDTSPEFADELDKIDWENF